MSQHWNDKRPRRHRTRDVDRALRAIMQRKGRSSMKERLEQALCALLILLSVGLLMAHFVFHLFAGSVVCKNWQTMTPTLPSGSKLVSSIAVLGANDVWTA